MIHEKALRKKTKRKKSGKYIFVQYIFYDGNARAQEVKKKKITMIKQKQKQNYDKKTQNICFTTQIVVFTSFYCQLMKHQCLLLSAFTTTVVTVLLLFSIHMLSVYLQNVSGQTTNVLFKYNKMKAHHLQTLSVQK